MSARKPAPAAVRPTAVTPKGVSFAAQSEAKPSAHRLSSSIAAVTPPATTAAPEPEAAAADMDMCDEPGMGEGLGEDDAAEPMQADKPAAQQQQQQHPAAAAVVKQEQQQQDTPGGAGAGAAAGPAAVGKTPWRTPAPVFNEAKTPATTGPASGWQLMYQQEGAGDAEDAVAAAGAGGDGLAGVRCRRRPFGPCLHPCCLQRLCIGASGAH